jgi:hypothetical protein
MLLPRQAVPAPPMPWFEVIAPVLVGLGAVQVQETAALDLGKGDLDAASSNAIYDNEAKGGSETSGRRTNSSLKVTQWLPRFG